MGKQTINVGSSANDGTGDKIRVAFQKTNENFTELYDEKIDEAPIDGLTYGRKDAEWVEVSGGGSVPDATESTKGKAQIATEAETITGVNDTKIVTPAKLAAAFTDRDLGYPPENVNNKTDTIVGNETSSTLYSSVKGIIDYFTTSRIKTILGITTLSGSNTGDQDLSGLEPKTVSTTGSVISFATPQVYNTTASPSSSNFTDDLTGARIGVIQKIYSNKDTTPTFPAGWVLIGANTYTSSVLNIIYAEWVSGSRVEYWIVKG